MTVHAKWSALRESRWYEYGLRFVLGGMMTVIAGVIASKWGPEIGGLFLAFPAILCASATLIEKHERKRKQQHGVEGFGRGKDAAALDAAGAGLGSVGLIGFALIIWLLVGRLGSLALVVASAVWFLVGIACWRLRRMA